MIIDRNDTILIMNWGDFGYNLYDTRSREPLGRNGGIRTMQTSENRLAVTISPMSLEMKGTERPIL